MSEDKSQFGIFLSLDGKSIIEQSWSEDRMVRMVRFDLSRVSEFEKAVKDFFVHLQFKINDKNRLPERCGMRAYGFTGKTVRSK